MSSGCRMETNIRDLSPEDCLREGEFTSGLRAVAMRVNSWGAVGREKEFGYHKMGTSTRVNTSGTGKKDGGHSDGETVKFIREDS